MKIAPIRTTNNITFSARSNTSLNNPTLKNVTKAALTGLGSLCIHETLKSLGITSCTSDNDAITIVSGYNNGFYKIKTSTVSPSEQVKEFLLGSITKKPYAFGGLVNYINMVEDIKRQDIIQKGLKIHTYEMNNEVSLYQAELAAAKLSKYTNKAIDAGDLFFIEYDAYYYDCSTKTAYSVNNTVKKIKADEPVMTCKFILDDKRNAIGYDCKAWNPYKWDYMDTHYMEQQAPSVNLKTVAEPDNNKEFAEAFRFGNTTINYRIKKNIPHVLDNISKKVKISEPDEKMLQIVKFYDKDKNIQAGICYYDSATGISFVYNDVGQYMYRLEYNKDHEGNIVSCNRL